MRMTMWSGTGREAMDNSSRRSSASRIRRDRRLVERAREERAGDHRDDNESRNIGADLRLGRGEGMKGLFDRPSFP
jgi:hypothetical protein